MSFFEHLLDHVAAGEAVKTRPGWNQADVDVFIAQGRFAAGKAGGNCRLQPLAVIGLEAIDQASASRRRWAGSVAVISPWANSGL